MLPNVIANMVAHGTFTGVVTAAYDIDMIYRMNGFFMNWLRLHVTKSVPL